MFETSTPTSEYGQGEYGGPPLSERRRYRRRARYEGEYEAAYRAPSGAVPVAEAVRPTVSIARALLGRAEELACNTPPDFAGADVILEGLGVWLDRVADRNKRSQVFRSLGFGAQAAMFATGQSIDAISSLRRRISLERGYRPLQASRRTWWNTTSGNSTSELSSWRSSPARGP